MRFTTIGKLLLAAVIVIATTASAHAAFIQGEWTVEGATTPADATNSTVGPNTPASTGTGTLNGLHASAATDWTTPAGNGSDNSYSVNTWAANDYFQISTSAANRHSIALSFDATGSATGPRDFKVQYSNDGTTFTDTGSTYQVALNGGPAAVWSSGGGRLPEYTHTFDFSGITQLNDDSSIFFRLVNTSAIAINGAAVGTGGTSRVDNILVTGVPEPATLTLVALGGIALVGLARRRG